MPLTVPRIHDPAHSYDSIGAEAEDFPHFFRSGDRVADDVDTHLANIRLIGQFKLKQPCLKPRLAQSGSAPANWLASNRDSTRYAA